MNAQVIRAFCDLNNNRKLYTPGSKFSGTEERIAELEAKGFVKALQATRQNPKQDKSKQEESEK